MIGKRKAPLPAEPSETSFEASLARLHEVVEHLESGELGLEQSLSLFEEGVKLARAAKERLDNAERRVEELIRLDEEGNPVVRELDPDCDVDVVVWH